MDDYFCTKCGSKMTVSYKFVGYSHLTGGKMYRVMLKCPNYKWWSGHDESVWDYWASESEMVKWGVM